MRTTPQSLRTFALLLTSVAVACGGGSAGGTGGAAATGGQATNGGSAGSGAGALTTGGSAGTTAPMGGAGSGAAAGTSGVRGGAGAGGTTSTGGTSGAGDAGDAHGGTSTAGTAGASATGGGAGQMQLGAGGAGAGGVTAAGGVAGAAAGRSGGQGGGSGGSGVRPSTWRIMAFGDSITGTTCYPQLLSQKLKDAGHTSFELIGSILNNQACPVGSTNAPNVMTEGHSGYILSCLTGDYTSNCSSKGMPSELTTWLAAKPPPDVVLMHFGTNDAWNSVPTNTIITAYTHVLASLRGANPNVVVFVAQILPMHPDGCTDATSSCPNNGVMALNAAIPAWATGASTSASPVHVVDIYAAVGDETAYVPNSDLTSDGVHPNPKGSAPIAQAWLDALTAAGIP